jgi:CubicO group peptidase (beta-lactamase class C family)
MSHSIFDWSDSLLASRAIGYDAQGNPQQTINERVARMTPGKRKELSIQYPLMNFPNAAASLITTAADYLRFLSAAATPGFAGLLPEAASKEALVPRVAAGKGVHWGLLSGLVETDALGTGLWHWGDFGIFQNFAVAFPARQLALVSFTNGPRGQRLNKDIIQSLLQTDLPCFPWLRV